MSYCRICRAELPVRGFDDHETLCTSCLREAVSSPRAPMRADELAALLQAADPAERRHTAATTPPRTLLRASYSDGRFRWEIERPRR
jgi:hypothetical protein